MIEFDKCVKCGSTKNLKFHNYKYLGEIRSAPACYHCRKEFHNYDNAKSSYKLLGFGLIVNLIFILLNLWYPFWRWEWYRNLWIPCGIIGGIIAAVGIAWRISIYRRPNHKVTNIKNYVFLKKKSGKLYRLAEKNSREGLYEESIQKWKNLIELNPAKPLFYVKMGYDYERQSNIEKARECYEEALKINPKYSEAQEAIVKLAKVPEISGLRGVRCLKCGSQSVFSLYEHSESITSGSKYSTSTTIRSIKIPICNLCREDFKNWKTKHKSSRGSYCNVCFYMSVLLIGGILTLSFLGLKGIGISLIFFIPLILSVIYISYKQSLKNQDISPFRYVKISGNVVYVRPKGEGPWIEYNKWINTLQI
ncbi:MAG: tetratricopeptide repeat protein [Promethearchaeota archaeon]